MMLVILLVLQVFRISGQPNDIDIITAEEAVSLAIQNNPSIHSGSDKAKLTIEVKSAWFQWLFRINEWQTLREHLKQLGDVSRIATLRGEEGDIEPLEMAAYLNRMADLRTRMAVLSNEITIAGNLLRQLLKTGDNIAPADTVISIYQIQKPGKENIEPQTLDDSLNAVNLQLRLDNLFIRLQYYNTVGLEYAQQVISINQAKLEAEEIDYLEFTGTLDEAFNIRLEYLKTINSYNHTAIELEHYAY